MKYVVMEDEGEEFLFSFPKNNLMVHADMAESINHLTGCKKENTREFYAAQTVSAGFVNAGGNCHGHSESLSLQSRPQDTALYQGERHYFVIALANHEYLITFPAHMDIDHKAVYDAVTTIKVHTSRNNWERKFRGAQVVSAGLIDTGMNCHGESESLGVTSRPEKDTALLKMQLCNP